MEWRGKRTSRNIEDRRGSGGSSRGGGMPGIRIGSGRGGSGMGIIGTIVVLLIGAYFGVDLSGLMGGSGSGTGQAPA